MINVDMTAPELDRQLHLLEIFPEILDQHFKPAVRQSVKVLEGRIRPTIPVASGKARDTFGSRVTGKGVSLVGRVGWHDKSDPWYPNVVEYGAGPHEINAYVPKLGKYIRVHPGLSARGFMAAGYSAMEALIEATLAQANENVVRDLALDGSG